MVRADTNHGTRSIHVCKKILNKKRPGDSPCL
jgi:hypothetical protein